MGKYYNRREALKTMAAASAAAMLPATVSAQSTQAEENEIEIRLTSISQNTLRLTLLPIRNGNVGAISDDGSLVKTNWGPPTATLRGDVRDRAVKCGALNVHINASPLTFTLTNSNEALLQKLTITSSDGSISFLTGDSPLLGLGEGGPQFDRRGSVDEMRSGQGGYKLGTHGGRVPIPWIIGTSGWAMFIHQPFGKFDFTGAESKFVPSSQQDTLPLDLFFIGAADPKTIM